MWPYFERLRREDPVHYCADSEFGPYWSITKYNDIMAVDTTTRCSPPTSRSAASPSAAGRRTRSRCRCSLRWTAAPRHPAQGGDARRQPGEPAISRPHHPRARRQDPRFASIGEKFDWVDKVSIELTTMTLATLFDFPFESGAS
ncbi:MAG: hypothetical protein WDM81_18340 [Rhizomicrobium sp.]